MQLVLDDIESKAPVVLHPESMTDEEFYDFCQLHPDFRVERTATGEVLIMPPAGGETGYRNSELSAQLRNWARKDGRGKAFDSNTEYFLPNGAALSPDASWVLNSRLAELTKCQKQKFLPLCPDFLVELTSPSDRLKRVKAKMDEWLENGAQLCWLLDADNHTVYVYRPRQAVECIVGPEQAVGEGPVDGFILQLTDIWEGL